MGGSPPPFLWRRPKAASIMLDDVSVYVSVCVLFWYVLVCFRYFLIYLTYLCICLICLLIYRYVYWYVYIYIWPCLKWPFCLKRHRSPFGTSHPTRRSTRLAVASAGCGIDRKLQYSILLLQRQGRVGFLTEPVFPSSRVPPHLCKRGSFLPTLQTC